MSGVVNASTSPPYPKYGSAWTYVPAAAARAQEIVTAATEGPKTASVQSDQAQPIKVPKTNRQRRDACEEKGG